MASAQLENGSFDDELVSQMHEEVVPFTVDLSQVMETTVFGSGFGLQVHAKDDAKFAEDRPSGWGQPSSAQQLPVLAVVLDSSHARSFGAWASSQEHPPAVVEVVVALHLIPNGTLSTETVEPQAAMPKVAISNNVPRVVGAMRRS